MPRFQSRLDCDRGYNDGHLFISAFDSITLSGTTGVARTGAGNFNLTIGNTQTVVLAFPLTNILFRTGVQDDLQEQFGSLRAGGAQGRHVPGFSSYTTGSLTAGSSVSIPVLNSGLVSSATAGFQVGDMLTLDTVASGVQEFPFITSIPDATHVVVNKIVNAHSTNAPITQNVFTTPAGVSGRPPYSGISQLTPVTSPRPKGIQFRAIYPWFSVAGAALTLNTIGLTRTIAANNATVASGESDIIANAANGLPTATQANPYLSAIAVPNASQIYQTSKFASYNLEWDLTTAGGGTAALWGIFIDVTYNYN